MVKAASQNRERALGLVLVAIILACLLIAYRSVIVVLIRQWSGNDNDYCYTIFPLFIYFLWEERNRFRFLDFSWNLWGILISIFAVLLTFAGELASIVTFQFIGFWGCFVGMGVLLYGRRMKYLVFPFFILLFIVPLPPFVNQMLTFKLRLIASKFSAELLRVAGVSVYLEGNVLDIGIAKLQVINACSGLRSLMSLTVMSILIGHFFVRGWPRKIILLAMVLPLTVFFNAARIFTMGMLTVTGHPKLAQGAFHDITGLVVFIVSSGILVVVALALRKKMAPDAEKKLKKDPGARFVGYTRPVMLALILCLLFIGNGLALSRVSEKFVVPKRETFKNFPSQINAWMGKRIYLSKGIIKSVGMDDYIDAVYVKNSLGNKIYELIPFYNRQRPYHSAHAPQSRLLGGGWEPLKIQRRLIDVAPGKKIPIMEMSLEKGDRHILATYFFFQRGRVFTSPWENKLYLMLDAFKKGRTDGALVRVEMVLTPGQSFEDAYPVLVDFIRGLWRKSPGYIPT